MNFPIKANVFGLFDYHQMAWVVWVFYLHQIWQADKPFHSLQFDYVLYYRYPIFVEYFLKDLNAVKY